MVDRDQCTLLELRQKIHAVRQQLGLQLSLEDKPPRCREYVEDKIFAI
ncbi:MAG: hypothetical protein RIB93_05085 [Coleofasciculus sp. D1-CHI-01]